MSEDKLQTREQMLASMAQQSNGWIKHDGGPCPVSENTSVIVMFGDGSCEETPTSARFWAGASEDWWKHEADDPEFDIIAYRVVQS